METKHLIIRESKWEDIDTFYRWELIPEVTEFFSIRDNQSKEEVVKKYIEDDYDEKARQFTIVLKDESDCGAGAGNPSCPERVAKGTNNPDGTDCETADSQRIIGRVVLADLEPEWKVEIWRIYIGELDCRGKGYGRETMRAIMKYCFEHLGLQRVYLDHYTGNPASELYLSLGFKYEGVLRKNCRKNGKLYDVHLMSMLKEEYEELYK